MTISTVMGQVGDPTSFDLSTLGLSGVFLIAGGIIIRALWNRIKELEAKIEAITAAYHTQSEGHSVVLDRVYRAMEHQVEKISPELSPSALKQIEELLKELRK